MNQTPQFTPGPWEVSGTSVVTDDYCIAVIEEKGDYPAPHKQRIANASLLAAAPDLLAALKAVEWGGLQDDEEGGWIECCPDCGCEKNYGHDVDCNVYAAIAKAEGGSL